jgi:hypothetical protein
MAEQFETGLDQIGGLEDKMATEDLLSIYQAFPHFVKATELTKKVDNYHEQIINLTERIDQLQICPLLRLKRQSLHFLINATYNDARVEYGLGNSLLPPDKPFA